MQELSDQHALGLLGRLDASLGISDLVDPGCNLKISIFKKFLSDANSDGLRNMLCWFKKHTLLV